MKHLLVWSPVTLPGDTVYYWVEYQGEYERLYKSDSWLPSTWCSPTEDPKCDVTGDITAVVSYSLRVRAASGLRTSAWSALKFSQHSTLLTPPRIRVLRNGSHLFIQLEDLGLKFQFLVVYWRKEPGAEEHKTMVTYMGHPVHLQAMKPGAKYCAKARTVVQSIDRQSPFSQAQCVEAQETLPLGLALFAFVATMLLLVALPFSMWKMGQLLCYSCCPVVVLPETLKLTKPSQKLEAWKREEKVDACSLTVLPPEEVFGAWM
ncbi:interleukin-20 receptor subunit beta isoform 2-T2 [Thomomys bottae]